MVRGVCLVIGLTLGLGVWFFMAWMESIIQKRLVRQALRPVEVEKSSNLALDWFEKLLNKESRRKGAKMFPDFLDLLALGMSAGLPLERAWTLAVAQLPLGPLSADLTFFENSVRWGKPRSEAMKELAMRLAEPQLQMTLALLEQAMKRGNQLQETLVDQARALRQKRFSQMEKSAQTASLRLLFPIFVFILPAVFLILFAPLVISLSQGGSFF